MMTGLLEECAPVLSGELFQHGCGAFDLSLQWLLNVERKQRVPRIGQRLGRTFVVA